MPEKHSSPREDASSVKLLFCEGQGLKSKFDPSASDNLNLLQELNDLNGAAFLRTSQIFVSRGKNKDCVRLGKEFCQFQFTAAKALG